MKSTTMTNQQHPIVPPPELVQKWFDDARNAWAEPQHHVATCAAQWGSDQELEACCEWLCTGYAGIAEQLRAARRPKPPSLKEQALAAFTRLKSGSLCLHPFDDENIVRRALEQLGD